MPASKTLDETVVVALMASTTSKVDQWKLAGLCGVPKTSVENWLASWNKPKAALIQQKKNEGVLDEAGEVNKDEVEAGRSTGPGKKTKKGSAGGDGDAVLHGTAGGRVTKKQGSMKSAGLS